MYNETYQESQQNLHVIVPLNYLIHCKSNVYNNHQNFSFLKSVLVCHTYNQRIIFFFFCNSFHLYRTQQIIVFPSYFNSVWISHFLALPHTSPLIFYCPSLMICNTNRISIIITFNLLFHPTNLFIVESCLNGVYSNSTLLSLLYCILSGLPSAVYVYTVTIPSLLVFLSFFQANRNGNAPRHQAYHVYILPVQKTSLSILHNVILFTCSSILTITNYTICLYHMYIQLYCQMHLSLGLNFHYMYKHILLDFRLYPLQM